MYKYLILLLLVGCGSPGPRRHVGKYISVTIDESCDDKYQEALNEAMNKWNDILNDNYIIVYNARSNNKIYCKKEWDDKESNVQAINKSYFVMGYITNFEILFNEKNFDFALEPDRRQVNLFNVMAHEIGHALSLPHINVNGCIMFPKEGKGSKNKELCIEEVLSLLKLYKIN